MSSNVRPESMERITNFELAQKFIDQQVAEVRAQVGDKKVLLALSGGVDSSVVAALLIKAIGKQLVCVHVNFYLSRPPTLTSQPHHRTLLQGWRTQQTRRQTTYGVRLQSL